MVESVFVLGFWILLLIMLTEMGFAISSWHSLKQAAAETVSVGVSLPLPNNLTVSNVTLDTNRARCDTNLNNRVFTKAEGQAHLICLAGLIMKAHIMAKSALSVDRATMDITLVGGVNVPGSMLTIAIHAKHKPVFGIWPTLSLHGTNTARYVFPPY